MDRVAIPYWNEVDLDAVCTRMKLMAFDLDGTLARSKKPMEPDIAESFSMLTTHVPVAVVSGGRLALVMSQVVNMLTPQARRETMHLMPTSGTRYYRWKHGEWVEQYAHNIADDDRAAVIASFERHAKELGLWQEHVWGDRIEDRGSQITFSALGQQAPVEAKEQWDPTNKMKNRLAQAVQADVPHLQVRSGGSTSVDASLCGYDKAFAVRELADELGIAVHDIVFVGDRMDPDGNDYPAAVAGTMALRVRGPEDTLALCRAVNTWFARRQEQR